MRFSRALQGVLAVALATVMLPVFPASGFADPADETETNQHVADVVSGEETSPTVHADSASTSEATSVLGVTAFTRQGAELVTADAGAATVNGVSYPTIQEAINAVHALPTPAAATTYEILINDGTYNESLGIIQEANKNIVLAPVPGASVVFTGNILIDGNGRISNPETLTIKDITFDFSAKTAAADCIASTNTLVSGSHYSYVHNLTIDGCDFIGNNQIETAPVVGLRITSGLPGQGRNFTITNCITSNGMHSLAQFLGGGNGQITITNNTLRETGSGVNLVGASYTMTFDNNDFEIGDYALRLGSGTGAVDTASTVSVTNSNLTSNSSTVGIIVFRGGAAANVAINNSVLVNEDPTGPVVQNIVPANAAGFNLDLENNQWGATGTPTADMFAGIGATVDDNPAIGILNYQIVVTFDANGGAFSDDSTVVNMPATVSSTDLTSDAVFPETPEWEGHTFIGWATAPVGGTLIAADDLTALTASSGFYAIWQANDDGNGSQDTTGSVTATATTSTTTTPASTSTPKTGDSGLTAAGLLALIASAVFVVGTVGRKREEIVSAE